MMRGGDDARMRMDACWVGIRLDANTNRQNVHSNPSAVGSCDTVGFLYRPVPQAVARKDMICACMKLPGTMKLEGKWELLPRDIFEQASNAVWLCIRCVTGAWRHFHFLFWRFV